MSLVDGHRWQGTPRTLAHERDFYRVEDVPDVDPGAFEKALAAFEGEAAGVVVSIVDTGTLPTPGTREYSLHAESAWRAAREAAREKRRATCHERKRVLVQKLAYLLERAASVSRELAQLEDTERNATSDWFRSAFAWPEFATPTATQPSRLADWRAAAVAAGLLDPSK